MASFFNYYCVKKIFPAFALEKTLLAFQPANIGTRNDEELKKYFILFTF